LFGGAAGRTFFSTALLSSGAPGVESNSTGLAPRDADVERPSTAESTGEESFEESVSDTTGTFAPPALVDAAGDDVVASQLDDLEDDEDKDTVGDPILCVAAVRVGDGVLTGLLAGDVSGVTGGEFDREDMLMLMVAPPDWGDMRGEETR